MDINLHEAKNTSIWDKLGHMNYVGAIRSLPSLIDDLNQLTTAEAIYDYFEDHRDCIEDSGKLLNEMCGLAGTTYREAIAEGYVVGSLFTGYGWAIQEAKTPRKCTRRAARELKRLAAALSTVLITLLSVRERAQKSLAGTVLSEIEALPNAALTKGLEGINQKLQPE